MFENDFPALLEAGPTPGNLMMHLCLIFILLKLTSISEHVAELNTNKY